MDKKTEYNLAYAKKNLRQIRLDLNVKTDADILQHLETVPNRSAYIKSLIRADIATLLPPPEK